MGSRTPGLSRGTGKAASGSAGGNPAGSDPDPATNHTHPLNKPATIMEKPSSSDKYQRPVQPPDAPGISVRLGC